ncbi:hypothetical protein JCM6882_008916 [Rhodosporidiobolus microsporus]
MPASHSPPLSLSISPSHSPSPSSSTSTSTLAAGAPSSSNLHPAAAAPHTDMAEASSSPALASSEVALSTSASMAPASSSCPCSTADSQVYLTVKRFGGIWGDVALLNLPGLRYPIARRLKEGDINITKMRKLRPNDTRGRWNRTKVIFSQGDQVTLCIKTGQRRPLTGTWVTKRQAVQLAVEWDILDVMMPLFASKKELRKKIGADSGL